jgi:uncharacterized repeat protein (TIGR01451 family)
MFRHPKGRFQAWQRFLFFLVFVTTPNVVLIQGAAAQSVAAPAGTTIGNQAAASYTDGSGATRTVTSNQVFTVVQQVAAVDVAANTTRLATAGSPVNFPHTITNLGNGTDTFNISVVNNGGDNFDLTNLQIFADANDDGVPDSTTPLRDTNGDGIPDTGPLSAPDASTPGQTFNFVVVGNVPSSGLSVGQFSAINVTATSVFNSAVSDTVTDQANFTTNANVNSTVAVSSPSGAPGSGPYTFTVTLTNTGNTTATNVTAFNGADGIPTGLTYVPGSGTVNGVAVTDAPGGDPTPGITYDFNSTNPDATTVVIGSLAPGASVTFTYQVNVNAGVAPQTLAENVSVNYFDGTNQQNNVLSNSATFTVTQVSALTYTAPAAATPAAAQGSSVTFTNTIVNTGNATDSFNITIPTNNFPAGTTFQLFQSDGVTPLQDTNGDGTPGTGPVVAGASYPIVIVAILPPGAAGGGPFSVTTTATSISDPTVSASATNTLTTITPSTVNLVNQDGTGAGTGPEGTPQATVTVAPGGTAQFPLVITNTSTTSDTYVPSLSAATPLPAGFTVTFRDATTGQVITNTGAIPAGGTITLIAEITAPAGAAPTDSQDVGFTVTSPTTGATDTILNRLNVSTVRALDISPNNQTAQVFPGNFVLYTQTITNNGNVTEGDTVGSTVTLSATNNQNGFTTVFYWDANNNGILDPTDPAITDLSQISVGGTPATDAGLDAGETVTIFAQVFAPAGAALGTTNTTSITTITTNGTNTGPAPSDTVTATTTVISGNLTLAKAQAIDVAGDGSPDTAYSAGNITTGAVPGASIRYRIVVTNTGTAPAQNVVVSDAIPSFTQYALGDNSLSPTGVAVFTLNGTNFTAATTAPPSGGTGTLSWNIGTLNPGQSATVTFGVRIRTNP